MLKVIVMLVAMLIAYKVNIWLGIAVAAVCMGYAVYIAMPSVYALRGNKAFRNDDLPGACSWFAKAYKTGRASLNQKMNYAILLMRTGDFDRAEPVLNGVILDRSLAEGKKAVAKQYRALLYSKLGKTAEALEEAEELFENYRNTTMYGLLGYLKLTAERSAIETLEFCEEAYDYNADDRDIRDNLALAYYKQGDYASAKQYADALLEEFPEFVEAVYHRALIAAAEGDTEKAVSCMETIDTCRWSALTTVSKEEVKTLKQTLGMA